MAMAVLYGASSGALHAVTGPDHLLSLGPVALAERTRSFRIGLHWGIGHALGTLALALPIVLLSHATYFGALASWGERLAGGALLVTALLSARARRKATNAAHGGSNEPPTSGKWQGTLWLGCVHGVTGAGSLLLLLPVLVSGSMPRTLLFLGAFALGSTLAMAGLTSALARLGGRLQPTAVSRTQRALTAASLLLGTYWLVFG